MPDYTGRAGAPAETETTRRSPRPGNAAKVREDQEGIGLHDWFYRRTGGFRPALMMVVGFLAVIMAGAALLSTPLASRAGTWTDPLTALFTATSATCVTGLVLVDTAQHWNGFGQAVLLVLIQIGGLGFMTMATLFSLLTRRTITLRERMVLSTGLNLSDSAGIVRLTRRVLLGTLAFEGAGAAILTCRFAVDYGLWRGLKFGVFHAVSAFCNAGFDLLGSEQAFISMGAYVDDPVVCLTLMALIIIGGLGFFVWSDVYEKRKFQRFSLHTKLTLATTAILLALGWALTMWFEWSNPGTLGALHTPGKILAAAFQSTTLRTAGFGGIDQGALTGPSQGLAVVLMLIGGSPGSTAGGLKTVTVAVLLLTAWTAVCGRREVVAFERRISPAAIMNAVTMLVVGTTFVFGGSILMSHVEDLPLMPCMYEVASAFGTAGLSMGITPGLSTFSRCLLIALMYFGRVGVLTLGVGVLMRNQSPPRITYPDGQVMVG